MQTFSVKELETKKNKIVKYEIDNLINSFDDEIMKSAGNTTGELFFQLKNDFILVKGDFETPVKLKCDRCTKDFDININVKIDEVIEVSDEPLPTEDLEFTPETIYEKVTPTEKIDPESFIEQYIILNVPTKKLCKEACINDNIEKLNAKAAEAIDPRWEKLLSYKDKKGE